MQKALQTDQLCIPFPVLSLHQSNHFFPHPFYQGLQQSIAQNRENIEKLQGLLSDEKSRQVLKKVIAFRESYDVNLRS